MIKNTIVDQQTLAYMVYITILNHAYANATLEAWEHTLFASEHQYNCASRG
jgi:hypothetical protein